jgi:hypothetical protein
MSLEFCIFFSFTSVLQKMQKSMQHMKRSQDRIVLKSIARSCLNHGSRISVPLLLSQILSRCFPVLLALHPFWFRLSQISLVYSVYQLNLLPLFNRSGRSHAHEDAEIVVGLDWISTCSVMLCNNGIKLEDPTEALVASLSAGHHWSPNSGTLVDWHL